MIRIDYSASLKSPLRVATGVGRAGWLDNTVMRNAAGHPFIPGSSIKGRVRATAFRISQGLGATIHSPTQESVGCPITAEPCLICRVFGAAQWPGTLHFADANLDPLLQTLISSLDRPLGQNEDSFQPQAGLAFGRLTRTNTAIGRRRRVVLPGRLFTFETIDSSVTFIGSITGDIYGLSADYREIALLVAALESITHLGGAKGRGMGRCTITVHPVKVNGTAVDRATLNEAIASIGGTN